MRKFLFIAIVFLLLGGCASPNVPLNQSFWKHKEHVKVAKIKPVRAHLYKSGPQGLLDMGLNDAVTHSFEKYLENYRLSNMLSISDDFSKRLKAHHVKASSYPVIDVDYLPRSGEDKKSFAARKYTQFAKKIGNDKLLVVTANSIGAIRKYYAFIPLDAPKAICELEGRLINVKNNKILWRYTSSVTLPVDGKWDQPPNYPNFTRALNKAIYLSKSELLDNFFTGTRG